MPRRLRPRLIPTLTALPMLAVLLALGIWQVERHAWKAALNAERTARLAAPPIDLPATAGDAGTLDLRRVTAEGRFDHAHEMRLQSRSRRGVPGAEVITPLLRDGAEAVLVNRGFVPHERELAAGDTIVRPDGRVRIEGVLRLPARKGYFVPDNDPGRDLWFSVDIAAMARHADLSGAIPLLLEAGGTVPRAVWPAPVDPPGPLRDDHLAYAATWFSLAVGLVAIYLLYHWRTPQGEE